MCNGNYSEGYMYTISFNSLSFWSELVSPRFFKPFAITSGSFVAWLNASFFVSSQPPKGGKMNLGETTEKRVQSLRMLCSSLLFRHLQRCREECRSTN